MSCRNRSLEVRPVSLLADDALTSLKDPLRAPETQSAPILVPAPRRANSHAGAILDDLVLTPFASLHARRLHPGPSRIQDVG